MSNLEYINYRKLEVGDQVSWEHPVTGKVYDFEVTDLDLKDEYQPVELQLLDDLEHGDVIIVSEYAEFPFKGVRRWPYISNRSYDDRYGYGIPENSITLDCLFYTSMHHVPKSAEAEEIENGRILAHRALMEDLTTVEGDGSSEISLVAPEEVTEDLRALSGYELYHGFNKPVKTDAQETQVELNIPSADEVNQYRYTSQADFQKMFVEQLAEAIKEDEDHIKLPPVLVEMYREELVNLGYKVYYDAVYFEKFD